MHLVTKTVACLATLGLLQSPSGATGTSTEIAPLQGQEVGLLGQVTGLRSVRHKKSGLEARLLEADGSSSVARDPIALFLVVTNNGTSDLKEQVWRLPRGVARVRDLSPTACGVDARVDVDGPGEPTPKPVSRVFHLCFLSAGGQLISNLQFSEGPGKRAG
jgi:hypothetical protein